VTVDCLVSQQNLRLCQRNARKPVQLSNGAYDQGMDNKYISERVSSIRQEIEELRNLNEKYRAHNEHAVIEKSAHQNRELRLSQIKQELAIMLKGCGLQLPTP